MQRRPSPGFSGPTLLLLLAIIVPSAARCAGSQQAEATEANVAADAGGLYKRAPGPYRVETVEKIVLHDTRRNKDLPLRVTYPDQDGTFPVVIWSHGALGSKNNYQPIVRHWASHYLHSDQLAQQTGGVAKITVKAGKRNDDSRTRLLSPRQGSRSAEQDARRAIAPAHGEVPTLHLPVQVYCYSFVAAPELNCTLSRKEIEAMVAEVNRVWKQAGIHWNLLSVSDRTVDKKDFPPLTGKEDRYEMKQRFFAVSPKALDDGRTWKIAIVHDFVVPAGGIYLPRSHTVYFCERTPRGKTKPVVMAHELGHSLGLPHSDHAYNLMGVGKPEERRTLTEDQIVAVRAQAAKGPANLVDMGGPGGEAARKQRSRLQGRRLGGPSPGTDLAQRRQRIFNRLKSFDHDGDGVILREDVPAPGRAVFQRIDTNQDGKIDASELADFQN